MSRKTNSNGNKKKRGNPRGSASSNSGHASGLASDNSAAATSAASAANATTSSMPSAVASPSATSPASSLIFNNPIPSPERTQQQQTQQQGLRAVPPVARPAATATVVGNGQQANNVNPSPGNFAELLNITGPLFGRPLVDPVPGPSQPQLQPRPPHADPRPRRNRTREEVFEAVEAERRLRALARAAEAQAQEQAQGTAPGTAPAPGHTWSHPHAPQPGPPGPPGPHGPHGPPGMPPAPGMAGAAAGAPHAFNGNNQPGQYAELLQQLMQAAQNVPPQPDLRDEQGRLVGAGHAFQALGDRQRDAGVHALGHDLSHRRRQPWLRDLTVREVHEQPNDGRILTDADFLPFPIAPAPVHPPPGLLGTVQSFTGASPYMPRDPSTIPVRPQPNNRRARGLPPLHGANFIPATTARAYPHATTTTTGAAANQPAQQPPRPPVRPPVNLSKFINNLFGSGPAPKAREIDAPRLPASSVPVHQQNEGLGNSGAERFRHYPRSGRLQRKMNEPDFSPFVFDGYEDAFPVLPGKSHPLEELDKARYMERIKEKAIEDGKKKQPELPPPSATERALLSRLPFELIEHIFSFILPEENLRLAELLPYLKDLILDMEYKDQFLYEPPINRLVGTIRRPVVANIVDGGKHCLRLNWYPSDQRITYKPWVYAIHKWFPNVTNLTLYIREHYAGCLVQMPHVRRLTLRLKADIEHPASVEYMEAIRVHPTIEEVLLMATSDDDCWLLLYLMYKQLSTYKHIRLVELDVRGPQFLPIELVPVFAPRLIWYNQFTGTHACTADLARGMFLPDGRDVEYTRLRRLELTTCCGRSDHYDYLDMSQEKFPSLTALCLTRRDVNCIRYEGTVPVAMTRFLTSGRVWPKITWLSLLPFPEEDVGFHELPKMFPNVQTLSVDVWRLDGADGHGREYLQKNDNTPVIYIDEWLGWFKALRNLRLRGHALHLELKNGWSANAPEYQRKPGDETKFALRVPTWLDSIELCSFAMVSHDALVWLYSLPKMHTFKLTYYRGSKWHVDFLRSVFKFHNYVERVSLEYSLNSTPTDILAMVADVTPHLRIIVPGIYEGMHLDGLLSRHPKVKFDCNTILWDGEF